MDFDLSAVGGRPTLLMGADPADPANTFWNFGVAPATPHVEGVIKATPSLYDRFPAMRGRWDGKSTVNHWDAARTVMGDRAEDLIQYQPFGTCGGRAGSFAGDLIQCVLIAAGQRAKMHRVSHAAIYYAARKLGGMLSGQTWDRDNDGVPSGSVPEALSRVAGYVQRDESGDANWYGAGSDDLAAALGCGQRPDLGAKIEAAGRDNFLTNWSPVYSAAELADGIAAGGVGVGSDSQGFTMGRDGDGFCSPSGRWDHYQTRCSVGAFGGRKGFGYNQSWGKKIPSGPNLPGHPGNCFGVDFDVQDQIIRNGRWAVVFGFPLFDLEQGGVDLPWMF